MVNTGTGETPPPARYRRAASYIAITFSTGVIDWML
jgi:hypothetical protein